MRSFRLALIGLFIVAGVVGCTSDDPWVGEWKSVPTEEAELENPEDWLEVLLVLERNKIGQLIGSMDIPEHPNKIITEDGKWSLAGTVAEREIVVFDDVTELSNVLKLRYLIHVEGFQTGEWTTLTLTRPDGNTLVSLEYVSINDFRLPMRYERVP